MKKNLILSTAGFLAAAHTSFAAAITTAVGDGADAYVWKGTNGNTNYGSAAIIYSQDFSASSSVLSYVRFDLSGYVPGSFTSATLDLVSVLSNPATGNPFYIYGLKDSENADSWAEGTITYNTAPGLTIGGGVASADIDAAKADLLGSAIQVNSGATVSFSDANLLSFLNADTDGAVTLIISAPIVAFNPAYQWASKEDGVLAPPTLNFDVVPEPTTLALSGLGVLGLILRRRR